MERCLRILIAEGNQDVAETLEATLTALAHCVVVARTFEDAVAAQRRCAFDVFFIDLDFYEYGAPSLLSALRGEEEGGKAARAVGWTAAVNPWFCASATNLFDAALAKPASLRMITAALAGEVCPECLKALNAAHLISACQ